MMLSLSPTTYHAAGALVFRAAPGTNLEDIPVRISRSRVIGGGAVLEHYGQHDADRTLRIQTRLSKSDNDRLKTMLANETEFTLATPFGVFVGAVEQRTGAGGDVRIRFLVSTFTELPAVSVERPADPVTVDVFWGDYIRIQNDGTATNAVSYELGLREFYYPTYHPERIWMEFNPGIPQGATITEAVYIFNPYTGDSDGYSNPCLVDIYVQNLDDSIKPTSIAEWDSAPKAGPVLWTISDLWTELDPLQSADFKTALQTVVNRPGWSEASYAGMMLTANASATVGPFRRIERNGSTLRVSYIT